MLELSVVSGTTSAWAVVQAGIAKHFGAFIALYWTSVVLHALSLYPTGFLPEASAASQTLSPRAITQGISSTATALVTLDYSRGRDLPETPSQRAKREELEKTSGFHGWPETTWHNAAKEWCGKAFTQRSKEELRSNNRLFPSSAWSCLSYSALSRHGSVSLPVTRNKTPKRNEKTKTPKQNKMCQ